MTGLNQQQPLSEEIHEIISYKPAWVIRKGNIIFLVVLLFLLSLSFIIQYPDVVNASVRIAAFTAPRMLTARTEGRLEKLLVANGQPVKKGQQLAFLQNTARHEQVIALQQWIKLTEPYIEAGRIDILLSQRLPLLNELGEIQPAYQAFQLTMHETTQLLSNGYYQKKKQALLKDMQYQQMLEQNLETQKNIQQEDYALQQNEYRANKRLVDEKVIAPLEFNQNKSKLLGKEQSLQQMSTQLINNEVSRNNKTKELLELQKFMQDQLQKFQSELLTLKSKAAEWEEKYIITSPEEGRLEFISFLQEKQLLSNGQEVFFIQPPVSRYYAEMKAGQASLGKIKDGQKVLIKLNSYPSDEFGYISGTVKYISSMPNERDSFSIKVELPGGLRTNYNKDIIFRNNLLASAEIITDERLLVERLFGQLRTMMKR